MASAYIPASLHGAKCSLVDIFYADKRQWAITLDGKVVGNIGLLDAQPQSWGLDEAGHSNVLTLAELGYWLGEDHWGKGYTSEALQLLIDFLKDHNVISHVVARTMAINDTSRRILEKVAFQQYRSVPAAEKAHPVCGNVPLRDCNDFLLSLS